MSATLAEPRTALQGISVWPRYPSIYEINTWIWLSDVSQKYGITVDLFSVPSAEWDVIAALGFDAVWLMGVWERSPAGISIANQNKGLLDDFRRALPDFRPEDNAGSPYCGRRYVVDEHLGGAGRSGRSPPGALETGLSEYFPAVRRRARDMARLFLNALYERDRDEMTSQGLYVDLRPWNYHFFQCLCILTEYDSMYEDIAFRFLEQKIERILRHMLDENEFFGPCGIRSVSRNQLDHPFVFYLGRQEYKVQYLPAESNNGMFGDNSNWPGPVWMPVNGLLIRVLINLYQFNGDDFKVECPAGSGKYMTLFEVSKELARRLSRIFLRDANGRRPVYGGTKKFQDDPHWRDYILFYEYFHGDNGAGLGASYQTGWTGIIPWSIDMFARLKPADVLETGKADIVGRMTREQVAR